MDKVGLGKRLAQARELARMTQEGLGRAVNLDRTAISRLEKGDRQLNVPELVEIAAVLGRPLSFFVSDPVPAVVSRRSSAMTAGAVHDTTAELDVEIDQFAADVRTLLGMGLLPCVARPADAKTPKGHPSAERMAERFRRQLGLGAGDPVDDIGAVCERLGLYTFAASLGERGPGGGCVEVECGEGKTAGAAVINGDAPAGRRRMTSAHELGHWLSGDAYDTQAPPNAEVMVNSFAIHFLAPRAGVANIWRSHEGTERDRAIIIAARYKVSWSAAVNQLQNLNLIDHDLHDRLSKDEPRQGDYLRLELSWDDEMAAPHVSPKFARGVVSGLVDGRLTAERAMEMLRGTVAQGELPVPERSEDQLRRSFMGHDE